VNNEPSLSQRLGWPILPKSWIAVETVYQQNSFSAKRIGFYFFHQERNKSKYPKDPANPV
jgi:hypothetical protein